MKKFVFCFLFSMCLTPLFSAYNVSGRVIDAESVEPIDFVNVALFSQDSVLISGAITDENGAFRFSRLEPGRYIVQISFVGYHTYSRNFTISDRDLNFGTIRLVMDNQILGEIEVIGMGSQMRFDIDRRVFSVDQNIAAAGGSITEVLENIPSVDVDHEGNVSLRNNANVEIWINGRPAGLTAENRAQILQQMPAETIESIEIITNPSARFDPEGTAGIINLVMKKDRRPGYFGSVNGGLMHINGGRFGGNLGANINYSSSRLDARANIGYRNTVRQGGFHNELKNFTETDTTLLTQNSTNYSRWHNLFFRAGVDYHINRRNTIGLSGFGAIAEGDGVTYIDFLLRNQVLDETLRNFNRRNTSHTNRTSFNINLDYRHDFEKEGTDLLIALAYSRHNRGQDNVFNQTDFFPAEMRNNIRQYGSGYNEQIQFRIDYTNRLTPTGRLETGMQSTFSSRFSEAFGEDVTNNPINLPGYYNDFDFREEIHAVYVTYGERFFDRFTAQAGLRGEYIERRMESRGMDINEAIYIVPLHYQSTFLQLFPSIFLGYSISERDEIQLNYTRRISRPRGMQVNPFRDYSDSTNVSFGNPALDPEFSSAFELNYMRTWDNHSLLASASYRFTDNVIQRVTYRNPDAGYMESTFMNVTQSQSLGLELVSRNRVTRTLSFVSSINFHYNRIDSGLFINPHNGIEETIVGREDFAWNTRVIANVMFSRTFSGQITAQYRSPRQILQGYLEGEYAIDLGVRKSFFNRSLNVSANVRDLLNSRRRITTTYGDGFWRHHESYGNLRTVGLTVSYNFGNMQQQQRNRNRNRDDNNGGDMDDMDF